MEHHLLRQIRGAKDLAQDAVAATTTAIAEAHHDIARKPYAVLNRIPVVAAPARAVEQMQLAITGGVYQAIHAVNRLAGSAATRILDRFEEP